MAEKHGLLTAHTRKNQNISNLIFYDKYVSKIGGYFRSDLSLRKL